VIDRRRFEQLVLPHLDAAYNLARWLTRNDHDAEDVVQEAVLRACRFAGGLRGDPRPWLLAIVRNACFTWLKANRPAELALGLDERVGEIPAPEAEGPEASATRNLERRVLNEAIAALPPQFREVLVLRELEDLSYRDIARIAGAPIGTVMSRLSRARRLLAESLRVIVTAAEPGVSR
jgi:RNA polymerase sigma-70 factor (ECF subfamily)